MVDICGKYFHIFLLGGKMSQGLWREFGKFFNNKMAHFRIPVEVRGLVRPYGGGRDFPGGEYSDIKEERGIIQKEG